MDSLESICCKIASLKYSTYLQYLNDFLLALEIPQVTIAKIVEQVCKNPENTPVQLYKRVTFVKNEDDKDRIDLHLPHLETELLFLIGTTQLHIYNAKTQERKCILHSDFHKEIIYILPILFGEKKDLKSTEDFASLVNVLYNELSFCETNTKETTYKDGKEDGFSKLYDDDGVLKSMGIFQAGIAEGVYVEYGENGVLAKEINFQKGEPVLGYIYDIYGNKTPMSQDELANVKITD